MTGNTNEKMNQMITVFGGTGFLGNRIVAALVEKGHSVRIAARHPEGVKTSDVIQTVEADVRNADSVKRALEGASGAVNAVSLYEERRGVSFEDIHVRGAATVAGEAAKQNVKRVISLSGIGADPKSSSPYIRARGLGEQSVRRAFPDAVIIRPSVLFGPGDAFFNTFAKILRRTPVLPLFGGSCRLQPVFVDDVAHAIAALSDADKKAQTLYELGGPEVRTLRQLVDYLQGVLGVKRPVVPVPMPVADAAARVGEYLPVSPISRGQVDLLRADNLADPSLPGFSELGITPTSYETVVPTYVK